MLKSVGKFSVGEFACGQIRLSIELHVGEF